MFRSLMTIIRELYLYLTEVIFMLKHSVKLRRYIYLVMWQHVVERHVCCVQRRVRVSVCAAHNTHAALRHAATSPSIYNDVILPNILT